ncbi:MAG: deoxyribonuclease IV, partial [Candidatus Methanomethylicota archaeon]
EKEHHTLDEEQFGPDFRLLAKVLVERGIEPVIISESPILDKDAIKMKNIFEEIKESTSKRKAKKR